MTFPPPAGPGSYDQQGPYGQPGPYGQEYPPAGPPAGDYPPPPGQGYPPPGGYPPGVPNYGYPAGPAGAWNQAMGGPPRKTSKTGVIVGIVVVLVLGLGVGGFFGVKALTGGDDSDGSGVQEGSGEIFSPPSGLYSVEIPKRVVKVPQRRDTSIPSQTDLSLELKGKVHAGGLIKTGTVSGSIASESYDALGVELERRYAGQYEGHPEKWGKGAKVDKQTKKLGGRNAVEISARFSPSGAAKPSIFFRVYFVEPPSGPTILITCDWNSNGTEDIEAACDTLVASFKVNG